MTIVHKGPVILIGLVHTLGHLTGLTGVIHLDMTTMMIGNTVIGLIVTIDTIRIGMTSQDTIIMDLASQIAILYSVMTDAILTLITILHLVDNGKVRGKIRANTRVITIPEVTIDILTIKVETEARTEVIISMITAIRETIITIAITSQTMDIGRIPNQTTP